MKDWVECGCWGFLYISLFVGVRECVCLFPSVSVLGVRWFVCEGVVCVCARVCGKSPAVTYVLLLGSRR